MALYDTSLTMKGSQQWHHQHLRLNQFLVRQQNLSNYSQKPSQFHRGQTEQSPERSLRSLAASQSALLLLQACIVHSLCGVFVFVCVCVRVCVCMCVFIYP